MVFLDELAAAILDGLPDFFQVLALNLYGHEAVQERNSIIEIRAEHRRQEEPRLRGLRGLGRAEDLRIGAWPAFFVIGFIRPFSRAARASDTGRRGSHRAELR